MVLRRTQRGYGQLLRNDKAMDTGFIGVQVALLFADEDQQLLDEADQAVSDLEDFASADERVFESSRQFLEDHLDRLTRKIKSLQAEPVRGLLGWFRHRRRTHRIDRLQATGYRVSEVLRQICAQRSTATAAEEGAQQSRLYDPGFAHQVLMGQAKAGSRGMYIAPPGSGRLARLPMYARNELDTPRHTLTVPTVGGISAGLDVFMEDLPYALVKLVGFVTSKMGTAKDTTAIGLVEDLHIRGGTNLFLHEGPCNADDYGDWGRGDEGLCGLRHYPNIRSPNQAQVTLKASGEPDDVVILTASVVVDVLEDDTYGAGFAGPYTG